MSHGDDENVLGSQILSTNVSVDQQRSEKGGQLCLNMVKGNQAKCEYPLSYRENRCCMTPQSWLTHVFSTLGLIPPDPTGLLTWSSATHRVRSRVRMETLGLMSLRSNSQEGVKILEWGGGLESHQVAH